MEVNFIQKINELEGQLRKEKEQNSAIMNNYNISYQQLQKEILENQSLKRKLDSQNNDNQNKISLILMSYDEDIHFSIICNITDEFSKIEDILYGKYPELKKKKESIKFKINGKEINQKTNLRENNLNDGDTITIFI